MKRLFNWIVGFAMAAGVAQAQMPSPAAAPAMDPAAIQAQEAQAKAIVGKVLAVEDDVKAADLMVAELTAAVKGKKSDFGANGGPELTVAQLIKTDRARALKILPRVFAGLTEGGVTLSLFQRMVRASLLAAGDDAAVLTDAVMKALGNKARWAEAVVTVAQDTQSVVLPTALRQAVQTLSATVLPPAVALPGPYEGQ
jgi:hypothetical protein